MHTWCRYLACRSVLNKCLLSECYWLWPKCSLGTYEFKIYIYIYKEGRRIFWRKGGVTLASDWVFYFLKLNVYYVKIHESSLFFSFFFLSFFFFFFVALTCGIWRFPGQRLNLSSSWELCCSSSNARSFNPLHQARDQTHASAVTQTTAVRFLTQCAIVGTPMKVFL